MDKYIDSIISLNMQISKLVSQMSNTSIEERTATMLQLHVLTYVNQHPGATSSEVAKYINASLSSIAQLADRLERSGFIKREGDANDRRIVRISLTDEGHEQLKILLESKRQRMREIFAAIDVTDAKELIRIQKKIVDGLEKK